MHEIWEGLARREVVAIYVDHYAVPKDLYTAVPLIFWQYCYYTIQLIV